ncbi:MAG TPA: hypothetical protein VD994_14320 [Prosthecobacter sp.]|nr:hypothetical protein [Prosthecobacter sp.]
MLRGAEKWLLPYLTRERHQVSISPERPVHACIAVCDHFEPLHDTDRAGALRALGDWQAAWPGLVEGHRDSSGRGPRHTFFYPTEQYHPEIIDPLARLCAETGSEVEVHLHHDGDTEATLTEKLLQGTSDLARHGLLTRDAQGQPQYAFIHGNWALDNSHPSGRKCGVSNELEVLKRTGCYADLTLPSAPDPCQTKVLNQIYYAREDGQPKSHDRGMPVQAGQTGRLRDLQDHLLLVQGPLGLNWRRRKWKIAPRVENGEVAGNNPPTVTRLRLWLELCPRVKGGAPWIFIKLHTHGGISKNYNMLLGNAARRFYEGLAAFAKETPGFHYHYVTAREMVNLIHAAEDGKSGAPAAWLDYRHAPPPNKKAAGA